MRISTARNLPQGQARQLAAIYEESFGLAEREPTEEMLRNISDGKRLCYVGDIDDAVVAFAIVFTLPSGIWFLEYFAVEPAHRNQRLGSELFTHMVRGSAMDASPGVVFEVEDPAHSTGAEADKRVARIRFYRRLGTDIVTCAPAYEAPSSAGGAPLHYLLMWTPNESKFKTLEGERLRGCVQGILVSDYGLDERDDLVQRNLAHLKC